MSLFSDVLKEMLSELVPLWQFSMVSNKMMPAFCAIIYCDLIEMVEKTPYRTPAVLKRMILGSESNAMTL